MMLGLIHVSDKHTVVKTILGFLMRLCSTVELFTADDMFTGIFFQEFVSRSFNDRRHLEVK